MVYEPYAHGKNRGDPMCLDIIRCRFNALFNCVFEIPFFSPLDEIERAVPGKLHDLNFVSRPIKWSSSTLIENTPFQGDAYYSKIAVKYMLHRGIISCSHITHGLNATAHLPSNVLRAPLQKMEEACGDQRDLAQKSRNSFVGLMCIK